MRAPDRRYSDGAKGEGRMTTVLARQQQELANAIRHEKSVAPELLKPTPQGTAPRLQIYTLAYRSRLGEALKENYPVLSRVLGDEAFAELANAYLHNYPSRTPSIRWFGATLAEFAAQSALIPHPALCDLIRMEWALNTAFDAADAEPVTISTMLALQASEWPALQFVMHPSLHLLALHWNVEPLWSALSADENALTDPPEELPHHLLVWRVGHQTRWRSVEATEALLLMAAIAGQTFTQLSEIALDSATDNAAQTVAGYARIWVEAGMISGVRQ